MTRLYCFEKPGVRVQISASDLRTAERELARRFETSEYKLVEVIELIEELTEVMEPIAQA